MSVLDHLKASWRTLLVIVLPLACLPLILPPSSSESRCGFCLILMAVFWVSESFPLAVTALLPVLLFPLLGLTPSKVVTTFYMKDINFLLMGGLMVAIAIEETNLHKRFAIKLLLLLGVQPRRLMLGFMLATGILSMWISNTASTAMMIPVARALFIRLMIIKRRRAAQHNPAKHSVVAIGIEGEDGGVEASLLEQCKPSSERNDVNEDEDFDIGSLDEKSVGVFKALLLCVCYSANTGGVATLTGSAPQLVLKGQVDKIDQGAGVLDYASYMVYALPVSLLCLLVVWILLQIIYFGFRATFSCKSTSDSADDEEVRDIIRHEYRQLGDMRFAEWVVLVHFLLLVVLWLTRKPGFFTGWSVAFTPGYLSDAVPAVLMGISLFIFPKERPNILFFRKKGDRSVPVSQPSILQWGSVSAKFPWGVLLLLGGGFALADACERSGLSRSVARSLVFVRSLSPAVASVVVTCISGLATEITANTVVTTILLPILLQIARDMAVNPIYFMLPATIVTSCAFMLPVATPPNAIAFSGGDIQVTDMVKCGFFIKLATMAIIFLSVNTWGMAYFRLNELPPWFVIPGPVNITSVAAWNLTLSTEATT